MADLLAVLIKRHGPNLAQKIYQDGGTLHPDIWIIINGRLVRTDLTVPLFNDDTDFLTSPLLGGG
ncbi:hypothetical protein [Moorella sp. ACPs]|uniref:hypothetical protein n=1 Tax=Neomoorella carbonis TaxID=3062783 RepID=UPI003872F608